jgi:ribosomal protein S18 acetylase RimI-like enzyme
LQFLEILKIHNWKKENLLMEIMEMEIREIQNDDSEIKSVQDFIFSQIRIEYGIGPTPKFHYDILDMKKYYVIPDRNAFFAAYDGDNIIATAGIRAYDKDYEFFKDCYNEDYTASIWRLMVDSEHRRKGLARSLVKEIEEFAKKKGYKRYT